jgi:hypothetical protein
VIELSSTTLGPCQSQPRLKPWSGARQALRLKEQMKNSEESAFLSQKADSTQYDLEFRTEADTRAFADRSAERIKLPVVIEWH